MLISLFLFVSILFQEPLEKALQLYQERKYDSTIWLASSIADDSYEKLNLLGSSYFYKGQYDTALLYFQKILDLDELTIPNQVNSLNRIGQAYQRQGEFDQALESLFEALRIQESEVAKEKNEENLVLLSRIQLSIGTVLDEIGDTGRAITYYKNTLATRKELQDSLGMARVFNNIGIVYKNALKYDSALINYQKGLELLPNSNPNLTVRWQLITNLGNLYKRMEKNELARSALTQAVIISEKLNNSTLQSDSHLNLASFWQSVGNFGAAEKSLMIALDLSTESANSYELYDIRKNLADLYESWDKKELAYDQLVLANQYRDSLYQEEKEKAIAETLIQYETEKKEQQIALQNAQLVQQKVINQRNYLIIIALVIIVLLLVYLGILIRNRAAKQQEIFKKEAEIQLQEAELKATVQSQEQERKRFAQDLHDGLGQMITVLLLNIKSLEARILDETNIFQSSTQILEGMYDELKAICFNLMPDTLIRFGIEAGIREFAQKINDTGKVSIQVNTVGLSERLGDIQEVSLYRLAQEWINNIIKYSDADQIEVVLEKDWDRLLFQIRDNGSGFDLDQLKKGKGNGWRNMNSRAKILKGDLQISSSPEKRGTILKLEAILEETLILDPQN
ncbi:MAG: tetratricopeptide repeat protein [Cyclobacteriaceae bacterium]|nr:tetratricopeptide repeat protein [Cyclobacteriaceae bacterium]MDX5466047.1 tetratricopeptide repeat protein [Cyclobacteriaceae bacterium]